MIRKIIVAFGLLIFIYSLFEVLRSFRIIQERFVSIFEGEIVSKVSLGAKEVGYEEVNFCVSKPFYLFYHHIT